MCIALVFADITTIVDTYAIGGGSVAQLSRLFDVSTFLSRGTDKTKIIVELKIELTWAYFFVTQ